jgi:hypothetical protein
MIDCESLVDKMPEVAHGRAVWTPDEALHLANCVECAAGWRVIEAAPRLGAAAAARIDVARLTRQVQDRLTAERVAQRSRRWRGRIGWVTGLAAAAVLVLFVWRGRRAEPDGVPTVVTASTVKFTVPLAELEGLDDTQLEAVLESLDAPLGESSGGPVPSFGDLDDSQLERVLRSLEG